MWQQVVLCRRGGHVRLDPVACCGFGGSLEAAPGDDVFDARGCRAQLLLLGVHWVCWSVCSAGGPWFTWGTMGAQSVARLVLLDVCGIISAGMFIPSFAATRGVDASGCRRATNAGLWPTWYRRNALLFRARGASGRCGIRRQSCSACGGARRPVLIVWIRLAAVHKDCLLYTSPSPRD